MLNGAFMFATDLLKAVTTPARLTFMKMSSYDGTTSTGEVKQVMELTEDIRGRDVIIVEDIVETGLTMAETVNMLQKEGPASIRVCAMFFKPHRLSADISVDYVGMEIGDAFIVGYGLDYNQYGRNLPCVYELKQ